MAQMVVVVPTREICLGIPKRWIIDTIVEASDVMVLGWL